MAVKDLNMVELREGEYKDVTPAEAERSVEAIAIEINVIKQRAARDLLSAAVDVGRLLCEAKDKVPHGEWGEWLAENVAYSVSNANNMMRLYLEQQDLAQIDMFSNNDFSMFEGMSPSQVLALLPVPRAERAKFIEESGARDMSVREIKEAVKARESAEKRAEEAERKAAEAEQGRKRAEEERFSLSEKLDTAETQLALIKATAVSPEEIGRIKAEALENAKAEAEKKIEAAKKKAEKDLERARAEGADAVKKAEAERDSAIAAAREEARQAALAEVADKVQALEAQLMAAQVNASPYLVRFKERMEAFQTAYGAMASVVDEAEQNEPETGAQLRAAMAQIASALVGG